MKLNIRLLTAYILSTCVLLTACSNNNQVENQGDLYLSFTVTQKQGNEQNMYIYTYDLNTEEIVNRDVLIYNSQYPLAVYSFHENSIYFSSRDEEKCDQLHVKDLNQNKDKTLTNTLFAINYIIPVNNKLYLAAVEKGTRAVGFFEICDDKLVRVLANKDCFVWKIYVDLDDNSMLLNTYSQSELDKNMESNDSSITIGKNTIKKFCLNDNSIDDMFVTGEGYITNIGLDYDNSIYFQQGNFYKVEKGKENLYPELNSLEIKDLIYMSDNYIYYISNNGTINKYNRCTKESIVIYSLEESDSAINNAIVLSK